MVVGSLGFGGNSFRERVMFLLREGFGSAAAFVLVLRSVR